MVEALGPQLRQHIRAVASAAEFRCISHNSIVRAPIALLLCHQCVGRGSRCEHHWRRKTSRLFPRSVTTRGRATMVQLDASSMVLVLPPGGGASALRSCPFRMSAYSRARFPNGPGRHESSGPLTPAQSAQRSRHYTGVLRCSPGRGHPHDHLAGA